MSRIKTVWRLLNLPCREMARLASESLDRDLGLAERVALRSHLLYCSACRRYLRQIEALRLAIRQGPGLDDGLPGPGLPDGVRERIERALRDER